MTEEMKAIILQRRAEINESMAKIAALHRAKIERLKQEKEESTPNSE